MGLYHVTGWTRETTERVQHADDRVRDELVTWADSKQEALDRFQTYCADRGRTSRGRVHATSLDVEVRSRPV